MRWLMLSAMLAACDQDVPCSTLGDPSLQLGEGEDAFAPISAGHRFGRVIGPQGGAHIWVALRVHGIWPGRFDLLGNDEAPILGVELTRDGAPIGALFGPTQRVLRGDGDAADAVGLQVRLQGGLDTGTSAGGTGEAELTARVVDACGTFVEASLPVGFR